MTHVTRFVAVAAAGLPALALCVPVQAQTPEIDALRPRAEQGNTQAHWEDVRHRGASGKAVFIEDMHRKVSLMKKLIVLFFVVTFGLGSVVTQAQDVDVPAGAVVRMTNCTISNGTGLNEFSFSDVVERARALDFNENAPNMIWFRRPIYTAQEYQDKWDFQIAQFYPSYTEMISRRVAAGNNAYGRLPISCGAPLVIRHILVNPGPLEDQTAMLTRRCSLSEGSSVRDAYNRLRSNVEAVAAEGNNTLVQMWLPGLGGRMKGGFGSDRDLDFVLAQVGSTRQGLTERMDMARTGTLPPSHNAAPRTGDGLFSCDRPSMWGTNRIYQAPANQ